MNALVTVFCGAAVALTLAGCGTATKVVNSNPQSVSVMFDGDESTMGDVNKLATAECQKAGRVAVLRDMTPVDEGRIANYDCRAPS